VVLLEVILLSVNSPVTKEGVITRATPLPLDTFTVTSGSAELPNPPLSAPVLSSIAHSAEPLLALKLPMLCANAKLPTIKVANIVLASTANTFLISCISPLC
jgi:hypothetical protein